MAKTTKPTPTVDEPRPRIHINLAISEEDVIAYDQAGVELIFDKKGFRRLSRDTVEALGHENKKAYFKTLEVMKDEEAARRPAPRPKVLDPLGGHEELLLNARITDKEWAKRYHLCWKYCSQADSLKQFGYATVSAKDDPVECHAKTAGDTFQVRDPRGREDLDIILMKLPMHIYLQHQTAVSQTSQDRVKGYTDKFSGDVEEASKGRLKGVIEQGEPEKVQLAKGDLTPA